MLAGRLKGSLAVCALVLPASVHADELEKARAAIVKKKYPEALKALDAAAQAGTRLEVTLDILELTGVAQAATNHAPEAKAAFQRLLALAPERPAPADKKAEKAFSEAKQQNAPLQFVALPPEVSNGQLKRLAARVNSDALKQARQVQFSVRTPPETKWETVQVKLVEGRAETRVEGTSVEWFASLLGDRDAELARIGSDAAPKAEAAQAPVAAAAEPAPAAKPAAAPPAAVAATTDAIVFRVTPVQVVVLQTQSQSVDQAALISEEIARSLSSAAFKVTTPSQLAAVMGLERQRQLMGCSEEASSCVAELANALGAEVVVSSTYVRSSDGARCSVVFASGSDGTALERVSVEGTSDSVLFERLHAEVGDAASRMFTAKRPGARLEPGKPGVRKYSIVPAIAAVALGVGAAVTFMLASDSARALTSRNGQFSSPAEVAAKANAGRLSETLGVVFGSVAVAALAVAGVMFTIGAPTEAKVVLAPVADAGGGGVLLSGVWP